MLLKNDLYLIHAIADRAANLYRRYNRAMTDKDLSFARAGIAHEILTVHRQIVPLRLQEFLDSDDGNFAHDIGGIHRHLDDDSNPPRLTDCFLPRFAGA